MTIEEISQALAHLAAELHAINANLTAAAPLVAPVAPAPSSHTLPPRPGNPTAGAASHLANILNGGTGIPTNHISPEEQAKRDARQRALLACNEATRAMAMASVQRIVLPRPNLQDFINDPNYHWPGWDILAAAQTHPGPGTHVPRPI
jgi:hypothetical protein